MVIVRIWEGLGNQMFQYAYARAMKENGITVRLDLNEAYKESFSILKNAAPRTSRIQNFRISIPDINVSKYGKYSFLGQKTVVEKIVAWLSRNSLWKYKFYEEKLLEYFPEKMRIKGDCYVKGYFQDERYFKNIRSVLLKEFTPKKKIKIPRLLINALEEPESVSIHIRRGDYVKLNWALNPIYYERAISYIKQLYKNPIFLVFSDDLDWVKKNLYIDGRFIYVNDNNTLEDYEELLIMSRCKANIIANSTFSWWAAWLNQNKDKVVIAPKKWKLERKGLILEEWIAV